MSFSMALLLTAATMVFNYCVPYTLTTKFLMGNIFVLEELIKSSEITTEGLDMQGYEGSDAMTKVVLSIRAMAKGVAKTMCIILSTVELIVLFFYIF